MGRGRSPSLCSLPVLLFASQLTLVLCAAVRDGPQNSRARIPEPTQYEVAMAQTLSGVRQGTLPDPKQRKADGTPGTLLEAILPEQGVSQEQRASTRRKLAAAWRLIGASVPFTAGPTVSVFNMSYFRYTSVTPLLSVDWRQTAYVTPILVQYNCASCWVAAPADTVAMASAIAQGTSAVPPGVQEVCDCGGGPCCKGGWPEDAFNWITAQGNITTEQNYTWWAMDGRNCSLTPNYPVAGSVTGWERVPIYSQLALMQAVSMQPVMVYVSASSADFIGYNSTAPGTPGFYVYNGNCTSEVNHALVVVGFNTAAPTPYWILKNSWPPWGWGDNGYMYIAMASGPGMCGMLSVAPLYPINFPTAPTQVMASAVTTAPYLNNDDFWWNWWTPGSQSFNVCAGIINPCGSGQCWSSKGIARCQCVAPFIELQGVPTSKCVHPSPCTTAQFNPCGAGWCLDIGDGGYVCGCPSSFSVGVQVSGNPTCVPSAKQTQSGTYVTQYGDSCQSIASAFSISWTILQEMNPFLNCLRPYIVPGLVLTVSTSAISCAQQYAVRPGDTCSSIAYNMDYNPNFLTMLNPAYWQSTSQSKGTPPSLLYTVPRFPGPMLYLPTSLLRLNPTLNCNALMSSSLLCVSSPSTTAQGSTVQCGTTYTTVKGDTCASVQAAFNLTSTAFMQLNPGAQCWGWLGTLNVGIQLCVAPLSVPLIAGCSQYYSVHQGDSCAQIWNAANLSEFQLLYINPGLQCQAPFLYVGQQVCIDSPLLVKIPDPNFVTYTVQPTDTLASIQSRFIQKCEAFSISFTRIAQQNGVADWTTWQLTNGSIVIPCAPKVGASCGCVPSLTVCGGDFYNYPSYCDATCNFASPITTGACSSCQSACAGRYGLAPNPTSACSSGYVCPYPVWPPAVTDASKVFTCTYSTGGQCMCDYRQETCTTACAAYASLTGGSSSACYSACFHCALVPCGGPNQVVLPSSSWCGGSCPSSGNNVPCNPFGRGSCQTQCTYWNNWWTSNGGTTPPLDP